jgi:glutaryl-CoA dehydrogenase
MTTQRAKSIGKTDYAPPPIDGDFYRIAAVMNDSERALLKRVREFMEGVVAPVIEDYWSRDAFPFEIIPKMAEVGIGGVGYQGYGAAGGSWLLNGLVAMELARVDASVATFWGVHTGLSAGSIYLCGDEQQKQGWLPPMMCFDKIGSFGLTEPLVGSATSGGMRPPRSSGLRSGSRWSRR